MGCPVGTANPGNIAAGLADVALSLRALLFPHWGCHACVLVVENQAGTANVEGIVASLAGTQTLLFACSWVVVSLLGMAGLTTTAAKPAGIAVHVSGLVVANQPGMAVLTSFVHDDAAIGAYLAFQ